MKYLSMICTIALCFVLPAMAQESTDTEIDFPELSSYIEEQMQIQNIPSLAIAIVQADEIVYSGGFGVRSTVTNDPVITDTLFRIGSTTKPLTTIGLLMLVENG